MELTNISREPGANRTFPYQIINTNNNTATACLTQCAAFGYPAAGMEFGDEVHHLHNSLAAQLFTVFSVGAAMFPIL